MLSTCNESVKLHKGCEGKKKKIFNWVHRVMWSMPVVKDEGFEVYFLVI